MEATWVQCFAKSLDFLQIYFVEFIESEEDYIKFE